MSHSSCWMIGGAACTASANRVCASCGAGTWNDGTSLYCNPCTGNARPFRCLARHVPALGVLPLGTCPAGTAVSASCVNNKDRVCGATCVAGSTYNDGTSLARSSCNASVTIHIIVFYL